MDSITTWMNVKANVYNERRVPGSEKLSALDLSVYRSSEFVKVDNERAYCLVGDAAFGMPGG